jgi:glucose-1-phosphate adenylyltransferase
MSVGEEGKIIQFEEKPAKPKSNLVSMGVYIFNWPILREYLKKERERKSKNDFGKNIIPMMLREGRRLFAYPFQGYWKDVGTIESLWQSSMDLAGGRTGVGPL